MIISLSIDRDENIALSIIFNDGTLEIVLKGLRILRVLNALKLAPPANFVYKEDTTITKSKMFQASLK